AILSDLHLGEPYNMLRDQGVPMMLNLIKAHAHGSLRRLVLAGDVFEMSTPESMEEVERQARFFLQQARSRFQIGEVIWLPGNHDYSLFRKLLPSTLITDQKGIPAPKPFIDKYFGSDWNVPVRIVYPYLQLSERQSGQLTGRTWIIHHGHYFDE